MISQLAVLVVWALAVMPAPTRPHHVVVIQQFRFTPSVVRAAPGDTIVWENRDIVPHTADANDRSWASGHIAARGQAVTVAPTKGEYDFTCLYHANMKGKLVVR